MQSFVRCPTCRQKLLLASSAQGQRKRCPRCSTRFAVGSPLHVVNGLTEFLAFELFDQDADDDIEVLDDWPPKAFPPRMPQPAAPPQIPVVSPPPEPLVP